MRLIFYRILILIYFIEFKKIKALKGAAMPVLQRTTFKKEMHVYLNNCGQYTLKC